LNRPSVRLDHLARLTDSTGILEHATGRLPNRKEGYSTDDQARALWACLEWMDVGEDMQAGAGASGDSEAEAHSPPDIELLDRLAETYVAFMQWAQQQDGRFHNDYAYDRSVEASAPSDDCLGRCLWACANVVVRRPEARYAFAAEEILHRAMEPAVKIRSPRGTAYALAACGLLVRAGFGPDMRASIRSMAEQLASSYHEASSSEWRWYEPVMTYSNALLPWGMFWAYEIERRPEWLEIARTSLDFLIGRSTSESGHIRPVGNRGWCSMDYRASWDQQPIDVMKLALASIKAYEVTGEEAYGDVAAKCREWFWGGNDLGAVLVDERDGSCSDGLMPEGPSENCGAEAVISYLVTEAICRYHLNR
jgi:hypothetical protein